MSKECLKSLNMVNSKIDNMEKLLRLLLINSLIDDTEGFVEKTVNSVEQDVDEMILEYGLEYKGREIINGIEVMIVEIPMNVRISISELKKIRDLLRVQVANGEPVFVYNKINGMQRKSIMQAGISFGVKGKELHVTGWEAKK